jgi:hypothetical protein
MTKPKHKSMAFALSEDTEVLQPPFGAQWLRSGTRWEMVDEMFAALDWCRANDSPHLKDDDDG